MMDYCEVCEREVETKIITRNQVFNVCGEDIEIAAQVMVCAECGEELFNEEIDSAIILQFKAFKNLKIPRICSYY